MHFVLQLQMPFGLRYSLVHIENAAPVVQMEKIFL
jgi:hypothetical protein